VKEGGGRQNRSGDLLKQKVMALERGWPLEKGVSFKWLRKTGGKKSKRHGLGMGRGPMDDVGDQVAVAGLVKRVSRRALGTSSLRKEKRKNREERTPRVRDGRRTRERLGGKLGKNESSRNREKGSAGF